MQQDQHYPTYYYQTSSEVEEEGNGKGSREWRSCREWGKGREGAKERQRRGDADSRKKTGGGDGVGQIATEIEKRRKT